MRVIAGQYRSRRLRTPPGFDVRPTPDRLRESLFSVLAPRIERSVFVDAYAGCGAVGIEALSRGAAQAIFIEKNRAALAVLRENLHTLGIGSEARVVAGSAHVYIGSLEAGIYFLDPPYDRTGEYRACLEKLEISAEAIVIAQHSRHVTLPEEWPHLRRYRELRQGDNVLSFYESGEPR